MDLLYSRYSNPLEFMRMYIEQGRFGEFVSNILDMDNKRKEEENKKENERQLFMIYVHSHSDKSFNMWKEEILSNINTMPSDNYDGTGGDIDMTETDMVGIINNLFSNDK